MDEMIRSVTPTIEMCEVTDPEEIRKAREQRRQFDRNSAWLQANISEVCSNHRGRVICIAGEELFVANTAREAIAAATTAHPEDNGWFTRIIPLEKVPRIYAF